MSKNRFFVPPSSITNDEVRLSAEQAHQVCHVLRLKAGDEIVVLDDTGTEYEVMLTTVGLPDTTGRITAKRPARGESPVRITLFQSLLAREKFEWVLQKATEVGVWRFIPMLTERSIVRAKHIEEKKLARWNRICVEAAEQSHRGCVPKLENTVTFAAAAEQFGQFDKTLIATPCERGMALKKVLGSKGRNLSSIALVIGPEGGFSNDEMEMATSRGAVPVGLGSRILRTETAAVVAPALVLYELGHLES